METKFFYCKHCGNVIVKHVDSGVTPVCCGESMIELKANETEGVGEKHLPVVDVKCHEGKICVTIGAKIHPMTPEHRINFIYLQTENGCQVKYLKAGDEPRAEFCVCGVKPEAKACGKDVKACGAPGDRTDVKACGAPGDRTEAKACDKPIAVYAYCNIHGLWRTKIG